MSRFTKRFSRLSLSVLQISEISAPISATGVLALMSSLPALTSCPLGSDQRLPPTLSLERPWQLPTLLDC